jgi:hypothetical protein
MSDWNQRDDFNPSLIGGGKPFLTSALQDRTLTAGQTALLSVSATGMWPLTYQWRFDGTNVPGATNAVLALSDLTTARAGQYSVIVSNLQGAVVSPSFTVKVEPARITSGPTNQIGLLGSAAAFSITALGPPQLSYQWQFFGTNLDSATASALTLPAVTTNQAGPYTVTITNAVGASGDYDDFAGNLHRTLGCWKSQVVRTRSSRPCWTWLPNTCGRS